MLILASGSPRRAALLSAAGIPYDTLPVAVEEKLRPGEAPGEHVRRLAEEKARAALARRPSDTVLAADTIVVVDGRILGKPRDRAEAAAMLRNLSGRAHEVLTGVALISKSRSAVELTRTKVWFAPMTDGEISSYIDSGEPMDKAGGYAIQGLGSRFVERIEGSYSNVVGLPIALVYRLLKAAS